MYKNSTTVQTVSFYWKAARRYPSYLVGIAIATPLTVLSSVFLPTIIVANVLNRLSTHQFQPHHVWASFGGDLVAYGVLLLVGGVVGWRLVDRFTWKLEAAVERDMAEQVFDHLLAQSPDFHANHFGGSLVSQTSKLLGGYIRVADTTIFQMTPLLASLIFASVILARRAPLFVVFLICFALFYIVSAIFVTREVRHLAEKQASAESAQTGFLSDAVTNVMAIKSFASKAYENKRFGQATHKTHSALLDMMRGHAKQQSYFGLLSNIVSALALAMAVISVLVFNANLGTVFLILSYTSNIVSQLFTFSNSSLRSYNRALGDAADMVKILGIVPAVKDPLIPQKIHMDKGAITFKNVTFKHDGAGGPLFENLNLNVTSGEKIGLVGHSGSGKTTFTRLLLRFSDIYSGLITIDGQDIASVAQDDLRTRLAYVPQEPILFHRTLAENIGYADHQASEQQIIGVAKLAHADEFIHDLPHGYQTLVGERGIKLSGGQRQRIAIARAMLKNAPILLLDEATSALDSESELLIQDALWKLMEGRTAIVIAHRLSTIQKMDRIVVLDDGKIIEQGTHKELLAANGSYAKLWAHQSGGFIED
jgi:ATP-binding cassette subfamily B protein